jgi:Prokaryotic E2 family D
MPRRALKTTRINLSTSPYQRVLPRDLDVDTDPLLLRLDFHRESVVLHEFRDEVSSSRLVSSLDIAHALASELDLDTGPLPPETLWYVKTSNGPRMALWRAPQVWAIGLQETYGQRPHRFRLPMPGLVFVCTPGSQAPFVFAAAARPKSGDDQLFHCPTWNVFRNGRVCPGTHVFPRDPARIPEDFFKSQFSPTGDSHGRSRRHPDDLLALWSGLDRSPTYPLDDLMPALHFRDALRVGS